MILKKIKAVKSKKQFMLCETLKKMIKING